MQGGPAGGDMEVEYGLHRRNLKVLIMIVCIEREWPCSEACCIYWIVKKVVYVFERFMHMDRCM